MKLHPYIKLQGTDGQELIESITQLTYRYSDENDDECILVFESDNVKIADAPFLQEGQRITVEWGYTGTTEFAKRIIYIFDTVTQYTDMGIKLEITGHEKFAMSKMNKSGSTQGDNKTSKKDTQVLILGFDVLQKLQVSIEAGNNELSQLLRAAGINIESNNIRITESGWVDSNTSDSKGYQATQNVGLDYKKGSKVIKKGATIEPGMDMVYHNATISTYRTLRKYLDKLPGGPYIIDSRDDTVTIRTRNFGKNPVRAYAFKGEDGELIDFTPETKNRQYTKGSSEVSSTGWDSKSKQAHNSTSAKDKGIILADGKTQDALMEAIYSKYPATRPKDWFPVLPPEQAAPKPQVEVSKSVKAVRQQQSGNIWDETLQKDKVRRETAEQENINRIQNIRKELGATDEYNPELNTDQTQMLEPWEREGEHPIRHKKNDDRGGFTAAMDNTYVHRRAPLPRFVGWKTTGQGVPQETILTGNEGGNAKTKTSAAAKNRRENQQLETNPATATVVGNPFLETGQIVTITNVADKHAGNYYISEVEHRISQDGYTTAINKMVRQGVNKSKTKVASTQAASAGDKYRFTDVPDLLNVGNLDKAKKMDEPVINNQVGPRTQSGNRVTRIQEGNNITVNLDSVGNVIKSTRAKDV